MNKKLYLFIALISTMLCFSSCRKDLDKVARPEWTPGLSFPWIKTSMNLADILPQDSNLVASDDKLLKIVYRNDSVYSFRAADFLLIPEQQAEAELIRIDKLSIPDLHTGENIILWEFIDLLNSDARDSLIANNGAHAMFPAGTLIAPYSAGFNVFENFEEAFLSEGTLQLHLSNELPVAVTNVEVELFDSENGTRIGAFIFEEIPAGETVSENVNLQEIHISNHLEFSLLSMFTPGSQEPVFVDLNDGIYFELTAADLIMYSGTGIIEEQDIATQNRDIAFSLDDSAAWLETVAFNTAVLNYHFESLLPVDLLLEVRLPGGLVNGEIPSTSVMIPAGSEVEKDWDLSGLVLSLNHENQNLNSIDIQYDLHVFGSEGIITVDTNCLLNGLIRFSDLEVAEGSGYFGKRSFGLRDVELDFSTGAMGDFIQGFVLDDPQIKLNYHSTAGVPLVFDAKLEGVSSDGTSRVLHPESFVMHAAAPGDEISGSYIINKHNSSLVDFLSFVPETYMLSGTAVTNNTGVQQNFIFRESAAGLGIEMDLPLVLQSGNFMLTDTVDIYYTSDQLDKLESAVFNIHAVNGFPFNLQMQIIPLDPQSLFAVDTIYMPQLPAASTNEGGRVTEGFQTSVRIELDSGALFHLKQAKKMIIKAAMNTDDNPGVAALCTDYALMVKIGLQANINY